MYYTLHDFVQTNIYHVPKEVTNLYHVLKGVTNLYHVPKGGKMADIQTLNC